MNISNILFYGWLNSTQLESFLVNLTFVCLFLTSLAYWVEIIFFKPNQLRSEIQSKKGFFYASVPFTPPSGLERSNPPEGGAWAENAFLPEGELLNYKVKVENLRLSLTPEGGKEGNSVQGVISKKLLDNNQKHIFLSPGKVFMVCSNLLLVVLLVSRWENSGHFPLSNLYESLIFLSWTLSFLHLILSINFSLYVQNLLGCITAPLSLLMNLFAEFSLPKEMQQASPLVPALQSNWLTMHVTVMIISYGCLILGSAFSVLYLILNFSKSILRNGVLLSKVKKGKTYKPARGTNGENLSAFSNLTQSLDTLSYRFISLGFPFLSIGILSGAVWANEAWGSYWSWDPKETWALLTWLVFAVYLHSRLNSQPPAVEKSKPYVSSSLTLTSPLEEGPLSVINQEGVTEGEQKDQKPALIASAGFFLIWFCYLGVNLIGEGLHSYGFFKS